MHDLLAEPVLARIDDHTRHRNTLNVLLQRVLDAETGSRGFLLTGDERYLEPYNRAVAEIDIERFVRATSSSVPSIGSCDCPCLH